MRRGSIRGRFLFACIASSVATMLLFAAGTLVYVGIEEQMIDAAAFHDEAIELVTGALFVAPIVLIAAVLIATALSRRAARPIESAIQAARETTAHDLRKRLPVPVQGGELRELAVSLNELFARLDDGFGALASFTADASHELRTPLTVMATELDVALRHPRPVAEWEATARTALDELRRMSALVDGLLAFARAGADSPASRTEVDLLDCIDPVIAQLDALAGELGVQLRGPSAEVSGRVRANAILIEVAVRNLVSNALAATPKGGRVEVTASASASTLTVTVDDNGPGLGDSPEALFVPFRRGDTTADAAVRGAGVGLGLAIARRIAVSHGGTLIPGASPLGGARFTLALPIA
jgi:signal transduction histidine kinase